MTSRFEAPVAGQGGSPALPSGVLELEGVDKGLDVDRAEPGGFVGARSSVKCRSTVGEGHDAVRGSHDLTSPAASATSRASQEQRENDQSVGCAPIALLQPGAEEQ